MNNLDILNTITEQIGYLGSKSKYSKILENLPLLCAMGAQSSGKSSVIKRLTGIALPTATGTCSRIVTKIISRRSNRTNIKIYLKSVDSNAINLAMFESSNVTDVGVCDALKGAQLKAIQMSKFKSFVTDYIIVIYVNGPNIVNTNMLDFPGYTTNNKEDRIMVEDITTRYLNLEGTIVLHVCRADVDNDAQPGNDIIASYPNLKKIIVITYGDNIIDSRTMEILEKTINAPTNTHSKKIAVLGNFNGTFDQEIQQLHHTINNKYEIQYGTRSLSTEIETLMNWHMSNQFPVLRKIFEEELFLATTTLNELVTESPIDTLARIFRTVEQNLLANRSNFEKELRILMEDMRCDILNLHIRVRTGDKIYDPAIDGTLQVGMKVDIREVTNVVQKKQTGFNSAAESVVYGNWTGYTKIEMVRDGTIRLEGNPKEYIISSCQIAMKENDQKTVSQVIKNIVNVSRGLVNTSHIDIQPAIEYFAEDFANKYKAILENFSKKVVEILQNLILKIFTHDLKIESHVMVAIRKKQNDFIDIINQNNLKFLERINELVACNMKPLVFSSNDNGLNLAYIEITKGKDFTHDDGIYEQIYYKVKAYLRCQKDYVIEDSCKKSALILYKQIFDAFIQTSPKNVGLYSQLIVIPPERELQIKDLTRTIEILKNCITLL